MNRANTWVRVSNKYPIATDTVAIELVAEDGGQLPPFTAGAYIDIDLGYGSLRQYSLANNPAETDRYLLGVLKVPNSMGISAALHDVVVPGQRLRVGLPVNLFPLNESAPYSLLVGGGIGITPMLAFAHRLHDLGQPFDMHFYARSRENAPFIDTLTDLPFRDRIQVHFDHQTDDLVDLPGQLSSAPDGSHLYVCGPDGFMDNIVAIAASFLSPQQIHRESFNAPPTPAAAVNQPFEVEIRSSGDVLSVDSDSTLVEVLQAHGLPVQRNCPRGFCGGCAVTVLEGDVDHRDNVLPDHLRYQEGRMLSCVSRAKSSRLLLDL